jgi:Fe-S cluster biosynthesis and repair protein YggX
MSIIPATQEQEIGGSQFKGSLGKKINKILSKKISWAQWPVSVTPATQEVEVGELW